MGRFSYGIEAALARGERLGLCVFLGTPLKFWGSVQGDFCWSKVLFRVL